MTYCISCTLLTHHRKTLVHSKGYGLEYSMEVSKGKEMVITTFLLYVRSKAVPSSVRHSVDSLRESIAEH